MVLEPNFVVLDEPTSALDMLFQAQMVDLLRELQRKRDLTYMFISHDLRVVASLASNLIVMRHGKVVEEGAAADIFKSPKSDYTRACSRRHSISRLHRISCRRCDCFSLMVRRRTCAVSNHEASPSFETQATLLLRMRTMQAR